MEQLFKHSDYDSAAKLMVAQGKSAGSSQKEALNIDDIAKDVYLFLESYNDLPAEQRAELIKIYVDAFAAESKQEINAANLELKLLDAYERLVENDCHKKYG